MAKPNNQATAPRLGWIGLGSMGLGMAKNLQRHLQTQNSHALLYTNRTMARGEPLEALGGIPCTTISQVVHRADLVFISVSNDEVQKGTIDAIIASGDVAAKIVIDTTTVHPDTTVAASAKLMKASASFVAAPVFGASPVAEAGQLLFAVAGPTAAVHCISPFLKGVMGRDVIALGEDVEKAGLLKTTGNFLTAALMETISEAHVFAEKSGLGTDKLEALVDANYGSYAHSISKRLTSGAYLPPKGEKATSDLDLAIKDVVHGITRAKASGVKLPVAEVAFSHLEQARKFSEQHEGRSLDSSSMFGVLREESGLEFETELVKKRDT